MSSRLQFVFQRERERRGRETPNVSQMSFFFSLMQSNDKVKKERGGRVKFSRNHNDDRRHHPHS